MDPDIRPWYHLLYVTDQIKSADQKAYIAVAVVCAVTGFSHQGFSRVIHYLASGNARFLVSALISMVVMLCVAGLVGTLSELYHIVFPKIKSQKYMKNHQRSAIFWYDVAKMSFEDFKKQYMDENREDDLVVQIYVLSRIALVKSGGIRRLFTISVFTILLDVVLLSISKVVQQ
jgi:hypothetical protein